MAEYEAICVFTGSSPNVPDQFKAAASGTGAAIAGAGKTLVYGGSRRGLMGLCADAAMAGGGKVIGVIPHQLTELEVEHTGLTELHVVDSMHSRKRMMMELSDAVVVLPGGLGTLDEAFELLTWKQLGIHDKPIVIVNIDHYWDPMLQTIQQAIDVGFACKTHTSLFEQVTCVDLIIEALNAAQPSLIDPRSKWT